MNQRRRARLILGVLVVNGFLVGCGSDGQKGVKATHTPNQTATATPSATSSQVSTPTPSATATQSDPTPSATPLPSATPSATAVATPSGPPNILFIIMDDVGIDQMTLFGNGGADPPIVPNIDQIAADGVTFSNAWATPECSPSRSTFYTGRFPLRTGVTSAIIDYMTAQSQVSPYETTLPRLLRTAGYTSAMVGKYHLGANDPAGNCNPATRGFDYFNGNNTAGPPRIDTSAGTLPEPPLLLGSYQCGFIRFGDTFEPALGACYFDDERPCQDGVTGKACLEDGGLLDEGQACMSRPSRPLFFQNVNAYYVWPETTNDGSLPAPSGCDTSGSGCADLRCPIASAGDEGVLTNREYMTGQQTQSGIDWWNRQTGPRMLTVSYNSIHTPYQQPPGVDARVNALGCAGQDDRLLVNAMFEDMDSQIGVLLEGLDLATLDEAGKIERLYLDERNTVLVIIGDNGSFGSSVRLPFSPNLAKGTVFQTGVWVPLIVAGPHVEGAAGRDVDALVHSVDLLQLFAELAGVDVRALVPPAHRLDSEPLLPYLANPNQAAIRKWNYSEIQPGRTVPVPVIEDERPWPCVLFSTPEFNQSGELVSLSGGACNDLLFNTKSFCSDNNGLWFGPGSDYLGPNGGQPWNDCCQVTEQFDDPSDPVQIAAVAQFTVRDADYKLNELSIPDCDSPNDNVFPPYDTNQRFLLFDLTLSPHIDYLPLEVCTLNDHATPVDAPKCLDQQTGNRCAGAPSCLVVERDRENYDALFGTLSGVKASKIECPGDGNLDLRVDQLDLDGVAAFFGAGRSFYDMNGDALTNDLDGQIVEEHLGTDCLGACRRADLNQDNVVNDADEAILLSRLGPCDVDLATEVHLCNADLNGDGVINDLDRDILENTRQEFDGQPCPIVVVGQNDPAVDPPAVQAALDQATLLANGRVQLQGAFDFSGCDNCVVVRGPVILEGTGDPSGPEEPDPAEVTTITADGSVAPLVVRMVQDYVDSPLVIEKLWFTSGVSMAILLEQTRGVVELRNNRITGIEPVGPSDNQIRFGIGGAGLGPFSGKLTGELHAIGNYIDNRNVPFMRGDDNGIAIAASSFSFLEYRDNRLYSFGESIEIEGLANPDATIEVVGNDVINDAAVSSLADLTAIVGLPTGVSGGHPAALKVIGVQARSVLIEGNTIAVSGYPSAVCMMAGVDALRALEDIGFEIRGNSCTMDGQFAALQAGWAGLLPFYPPFFLENAIVEDNVFEGSARFGVPFLDWTYIGPGAGVLLNDLVNRGNRNTFRNNDLSNFAGTENGLVFWDSTFDNRFFGATGGTVIDRGRDNVIEP